MVCAILAIIFGIVVQSHYSAKFNVHKVQQQHHQMIKSLPIYIFIHTDKLRVTPQ